MKYFMMVFLVISFLTTNLEAKKLEILTSFTILADLAKNVAGDAANVNSLTKMGAEIHGYEPTPKDILKAKKADIILYNGLNLEIWIKRFLKLANKPSFNLTDRIEPILITSGGYKIKPNPHAWMSLENAQIYIENIEKILSAQDPKNANIYSKNAKDYIKNFKI